MTDEDAKIEEVHLRYHSFGGGRVREAVRDRIVAVWRETPSECRERVLRDLHRVGWFVDAMFRANAFHADGDLNSWFALETQSVEEIIALSNAWHEEQIALAAGLPDDDEPETEDRDDLEESGAYGRTVEFEPSSSDWIFIRFGPMPKSGRSQCGLIGEDVEDAQDQWRVELGNMTHEAGVCVFRAYRHPGHPGHFVLIQPHFEHARYGVPGQESHLMAIMPEADVAEDIPVMQVKGSLKTIRGFDGSRRCELGSDGEYLIDAFSPLTTENLEIGKIWMTERCPVLDVIGLSRRSGYHR
ncbi:hypothetical protein [Rhizobium sp. MHM7A]|uniref:hypothetical protein n=1 Tax=Rhizobium sp. MHM7A TaxID=2583233 RepID=UPI0011075052|nr:hypothetical protein [Rhizobium sp. MHM7A]TLX15958.1 hypothetical protein FFR93_01180 [Rhizobium sp. MHM7A]